MQGAPPGGRTTTTVQAKVEVDKVDRGALHPLFTEERRMTLSDRRTFGALDSRHLAEKGNAGVSRMPMDELGGRLETAET